MTERETMLDDTDLDAFFEAAREATVMPSGDVLARIMADAEHSLEARRAVQRAPVKSAHPRRLQSAIAALGGWMSVAGLASATLVGVGVGISTPALLGNLGVSAYVAPMSDATDDAAYSETDYASDYYALALEG